LPGPPSLRSYQVQFEISLSGCLPSWVMTSAREVPMVTALNCSFVIVLLASGLVDVAESCSPALLNLSFTLLFKEWNLAAQPTNPIAITSAIPPSTHGHTLDGATGAVGANVAVLAAPVAGAPGGSPDRVGALLPGRRYVVGPRRAVPVAELVAARRVGVPARSPRSAVRHRVSLPCTTLLKP
jgi:hypothetical protein